MEKIHLFTADIFDQILFQFFCYFREPTFALFTMAPSLLETVDNTSGEDQFKNRLHPRDIKLSQAMATSAAVVSFHMGEYETYIDQVQSLQIMLGLGMGNSLVAEPKGSHEGCQITVWTKTGPPHSRDQRAIYSFIHFYSHYLLDRIKDKEEKNSSTVK